MDQSITTNHSVREMKRPAIPFRIISTCLGILALWVAVCFTTGCNQRYRPADYRARMKQGAVQNQNGTLPFGTLPYGTLPYGQTLPYGSRPTGNTTLPTGETPIYGNNSVPYGNTLPH
ncbi:MAG: hypothetical protein R3C03_20250 [Pirellulaceae bacterium]